MLKYKVSRCNVDQASLEYNLNFGCQDGWRLLRFDLIIDQFNGNHYLLIFEKDE
jgi:hypothetical protein